MLITTEIIEFQGSLYIVKRKIKEKYKPNIEVWKENLDADIVLRKEEELYFLEKIQEPEIIEGEQIN